METPELKKPEQVRARNSSACDVDLLRHGDLSQYVSPLLLQVSPGYAVWIGQFQPNRFDEPELPSIIPPLPAPGRCGGFGVAPGFWGGFGTALGLSLPGF